MARVTTRVTKRRPESSSRHLRSATKRRREKDSSKILDVTLVLDGGGEHAANRATIVNFSPVFSVMFSDRWVPADNDTFCLTELPECAAVFSDFMAFAHGEKVSLGAVKVLPLAILADKYDVTAVKNICTKYMTGNLAAACKCTTLVSWLQFWEATGQSELLVQGLEFVRWNFEALAKGADFANISLNLMSELLKSDELVVTDEMSLFTCVYKWMGQQKEDHWPTLEPLIRLSMMTPEQLTELKVHPLLNDEKSRERIVKAMAEVKSSAPSNRLYTSDRFCLWLTADYHNMNRGNCVSAEMVAPGSSQNFRATLFPKGIQNESVFRNIRMLLTIMPTTPSSDERGLSTTINVVFLGRSGGLTPIVRKVISTKKMFHYYSGLERWTKLSFYDEVDLNGFKNTQGYLTGKNNAEFRLMIIVSVQSE